MGDADAHLTQEELERWGEDIGRQVETPVVIALRGDLGAGKSTLARSIARGAGVDGPIPSPTFNLLFVYDAPRGVRIHHLDLYRLERQDDVWDLGWEDLGAEQDLVLIEWPENAETLLPRDRWDVALEDDGDSMRRRVHVDAVGTPPALPPLPGADPPA